MTQPTRHLTFAHLTAARPLRCLPPRDTRAARLPPAETSFGLCKSAWQDDNE